MQKKCSQCHKLFRITPSRAKTAKYCSVKCRGKFQAKKYALSRKRSTCKECGGTFFKRASRTPSYCSLSCKGKTLSRLRRKYPVKAKTVRNKAFYKRLSLLGIRAQQHAKKPTSIEKIVYDFLHSQGVRFEKQKVINNRFIVDAYVPNRNMVIECDGNYWHTLPRVVKKDKAENAYLAKCGFTVLRLSETEIRNGNFIERMIL